MTLKLDRDKPAATPARKGKGSRTERPDGSHGLVASPVLKENCLCGVCANGELRCPGAATGGKRADCGTAFLVPRGDRFVPFNDPGEFVLAALTPAGYKDIDGPASRSRVRPARRPGAPGVRPPRQGTGLRLAGYPPGVE
jgi:hypothetical protein